MTKGHASCFKTILCNLPRVYGTMNVDESCLGFIHCAVRNTSFLSVKDGLCVMMQSLLPTSLGEDVGMHEILWPSRLRAHSLVTPEEFPGSPPGQNQSTSSSQTAAAVRETRLPRLLAMSLRRAVARVSEVALPLRTHGVAWRAAMPLFGMLASFRKTSARDQLRLGSSLSWKRGWTRCPEVGNTPS